jgi:hypothetical protein
MNKMITLQGFRGVYVPMLAVLFMLLTSACIPSIPRATLTEPPTLAPTPTPTLTPRPYTIIQVYPDQVRQTIRDVGAGNFIHRYGDVKLALDPVSTMNMEVIKPRFARVQIALNDWQPANPYSEATLVANPDYQDSGFNHATFQLLQILYKNKVQITASVWDVPDWMVENPTEPSGRILFRDRYPDVVESIANWLLTARDTYGVEVDYVSFNEANGGYNTLLSPGDVIQLLRQAGPRFTELGLKTKWLLGDCSNMSSCLEYIKPIWAAEDVRPYLGALSYHSWDGTTISDGSIIALGDFAATTRLEILCTEAGWDAQLWQRPEEFPDFSNALQLAAVYTRVLKMGRATTLAYWEMMGRDYSLNDGSQPYLAMQVIQQLTENFPPGSQVVVTSPDGPALNFFAAKTPAGVVLHIVNRSLTETFRINGLPDGDYELQSLSRKNLNGAAQIITVSGGTGLVTLDGFSVNLINPRK